ncbi:MAG: hypothetical protein RLZZ381_1480 [Cyanobacteriota bacterium]|jgi:hypothetical protein
MTNFAILPLKSTSDLVELNTFDQQLVKGGLFDNDVELHRESTVQNVYDPKGKAPWVSSQVNNTNAGTVEIIVGSTIQPGSTSQVQPAKPKK